MRVCVCTSIPDCQFVLQTLGWVGEKESLCEKKNLAPVEMYDEMAASYCGITSTQWWEYYCFSLHKWVKNLKKLEVLQNWDKTWLAVTFSTSGFTLDIAVALPFATQGRWEHINNSTVIALLSLSFSITQPFKWVKVATEEATGWWWQKHMDQYMLYKNLTPWHFCCQYRHCIALEKSVSKIKLCLLPLYIPLQFLASLQSLI